MEDAVVTVILMVAGIYLCSGVLFGLAFITRGVGVVDTAARGSGLGFRVLIFPGAAALWPMLLYRWAVAGKRS